MSHRAFLSAALVVLASSQSTLRASEPDAGQRLLPLVPLNDSTRPGPPQQFARLNFDDVVTGEWASGVDGTGTRLLRWRRPVDVDAQGATLAFLSSVTGGAGSADVQVSLDGVTWRTLAQVPPDEGWAEVQVDLSEYIGHRLFVQFAYRPLLGERAVWRVVNVRVTRRD